MDLALWELAILVVAGVAGGFINVMAGGGSIITVPVMMFLGVPGPVANATNRIPIFAQNVTACITYLRHGVTQRRLLLTLALCSIPGAVIGASVGVRIPAEQFNLVLAAVMVVVLILMQSRGDSAAHPFSHGPSKAQLIWAHILMVGAGFWGGFIQIGMGFVLLPILNRVLGLDLVTANIHKVFIILTYTIAALGVFGSQVPLLWWVGLVMAAGNSLGGWLGAKLTLQGGEKAVRRVLMLAIIVMIIKLVWFT